MPSIIFDSVSKQYKGKYALDNISFALEAHKSYSLLGRNGAGKSTILKLIAGLIKPDSGNITINGYRPGSDEAKKLIGYLGEDALPYTNLTIRENLNFIGSLRKVDNLRDRLAKLVDLLGLYEYYNALVSNLSRGTKQRVSLALSIIHSPDIILLDEPFNYIDIPTQ